MKGGLLNRCAKDISGNECEEQKRSIEAVFQPQQPPKFFIYVHVQDARYHHASYKVAVCKFPQKIHNQVNKYIVSSSMSFRLKSTRGILQQSQRVDAHQGTCSGVASLRSASTWHNL